MSSSPIITTSALTNSPVTPAASSNSPAAILVKILQELRNEHREMLAAYAEMDAQRMSENLSVANLKTQLGGAPT